jgi:predicted enzyme related to lactoylglutathione lyase
MGRVIHFDIAADDPERAIAFYEAVLDWEITPAPGPIKYWLISTGDEEEPGIDGGLTLRDADWQRITCFIEVDEIEDTLAKASASGGKILRAKTVIPGVGYVAAIADTEGNVIGLLEGSETAGF